LCISGFCLLLCNLKRYWVAMNNLFLPFAALE
jgi:hypothetical protein